MYIKNVNNEIIFEGRHVNVSEALNNMSDASMRAINLRNTKLINVSMDAVYITRGCFWGCKIRNATFKKCNLSRSDFRATSFVNCLFHQVDFNQSNFLGATFENCSFVECDLSNTQFSKPEIFQQNIEATCILKGASYLHFGESRHSLEILLAQNKNTSCSIGEEDLHLHQTLHILESQNAKKTHHHSCAQ
jgi:uncharacterized protein YjbI with pentapeptide repeats